MTPKFGVTTDPSRFLMTQATAEESTQQYFNVVLNWFEERRELAPADRE